MLNLDILLSRDILIELPEGTAFNKELFKGLYLKNYRLKDFLLNDNIGYDKYMEMVLSIILVPKDIAHILWAEQKRYYKEFNEWEFILRDNLVCIANKTNDSQTLLMQALRYFFGYNFAVRLNPKGSCQEEAYYIDMYDDKNNWLLTINKTVFDKIKDMVRLVNNIKPSELSSWNYKYEKHEKKALQRYYDREKFDQKKDKEYEFSLETILYFLESVSRISFEELFCKSLHGIYMSFESVTNTLRALSLNIGIYGGNISIDKSITNKLIYGAIYNKMENKKNLLSGDGEGVLKMEK